MFLLPSKLSVFILGIVITVISGQNPTTPDGPTTTPEPPITWFECPDQYSYHPHPQNCSQYLICVFGKAYLRACEGGLDWNDRLKICDWPNPKTTCMQMDDNTAYRPEVSPVVTAPPMPNNDDGDSDNWQYQSDGKYQGSQPLSRFKPDEDAARSQLTDFAGKKVVYFDSPKDQEEQFGMNASSNPDDSQGLASDQQSAQPDSNHPSQVEPPTKKFGRKKTEELVPIGRLQQTGHPGGAPLRMSSWDTGNDDFPSQNDNSEANTPSDQQQRAPPHAAPAQSLLGAPPPWAAELLARKNGRAPASSQNPPQVQPRRQAPPANQNQPDGSSNQYGGNRASENSFNTPPPPTFPQRDQEASRMQTPPPAQRPNAHSSWPSQADAADDDHSDKQGFRPPMRSSNSRRGQMQSSGGFQGGRRPLQDHSQDASMNSGSNDDSNGQIAGSLPSLRQPDRSSSPQQTRSFQIPHEEQQALRQRQRHPNSKSIPSMSARPNALSFAPVGSSDQADSSDNAAPVDQFRRVNPSPFSPNAITNSFSQPDESHGPSESKAPAPMTRFSQRRPVSNNFGSSEGDGEGTFPMRPDDSANSEDENGGQSRTSLNQIHLATRRPPNQRQGFGAKKPSQKFRDNFSNDNQFRSDLSNGGQNQPSQNQFSEESDDDNGQSVRRSPASSNSGRLFNHDSSFQQNSRPEPPGNQDRQWEGFSNTDDISIKDQIQQLSKRFPGFQGDSSSASDQDSLRQRMQFGSSSQQFPFASDEVQSGTSQSPSSESNQNDIPSQFFPMTSHGGPPGQKKSRPMSVSGDHRDDDFTAPSNYNEQRLEQFYSGI